jgi:hypothetical protein
MREEENEEPEPSKLMTLFAESIVGLVLGALILWSLIVSVTDAEFVYQGF